MIYMIKLSEMYRISGGCMAEHCCNECNNFINTKELSYMVYPKDYGTVWDGSRMACKYFREKSQDGQMDISYLMIEFARKKQKGDSLRPGQGYSGLLKK